MERFLFLRSLGCWQPLSPTLNPRGESAENESTVAWFASNACPWPSVARLLESVGRLHLSHSSSMHSQNHLGYLKPLRLLFLLNNHYFSSKKILFLNHDLSPPGQNRVLTRFSSCCPHFVPHPEVQARLQCWTACPLKHLADPEHPLWARHCKGRK